MIARPCRPGPCCPTCREPISGGPVEFWCYAGRHRVQAADISNEFRSQS